MTDKNNNKKEASKQKIVVIDRETVTKMRQWATDHVQNYSGHSQYGHNTVEGKLSGVMAEHAVKMCYNEGDGVTCRHNLANNAPDLTVDEQTLMEANTRNEEVKSWQTGFSWNNYGQTITDYHANKYYNQRRQRIWFCEVDIAACSVIIHGWATPSECLEAPTLETSSGINRHIEVLHGITEVMPWIEASGVGWW